MKRITLDDIQRYLDTLPEPARLKYLRENGEIIRFLYEREKEIDHDKNGTDDNDAAIDNREAT